jgi:two-component system phosphate regulon sensor histidine kinase PhoR
MTGWIVAAVCAALAAWLWVNYRRARLQADSFRAEAQRRIQELHSLGYDEDHVGRRVSAVGDASTDAILVCKADHTLIYLNPVAEVLFGKLPETLHNLITVTRHYDIDRLASDALEAGEDLDRQILVNGRAFRARAATYAGGVVMVLSDVSELQRLGRARRDFVANISHELRTPLTSIRLLLDTLLLSAPKLGEEATASLKKIEVEVQALQQMAQELLDLAQIESGQALVRLVPTRVADLVAASVERLAPQIERKGQTVNVEVPPELVALADGEQVSRALANLLHNAIKFTPPQGRIAICARLLDGDVLLEISDTGPGIPPDDIPRVFERFFRGDRSRQGGGTGLGLAVAKHVIEAHGGQIWVESEGRPGRGAVFRLTLPAADQTTEPI